MPSTTRATLCWLIPTLLLLTLLSSLQLDDMIWIDELYTLGNIGGLRKTPFTPTEIITSLTIQSPQHVPGYFFLLSAWAGLTGWHPLTLRLPSLFFALIAVALTYRLGRDYFSVQTGRYAAGLLALSALFIHFSHEMRMYSLVAMLTVAVLWLYLRLIRTDSPPRRWHWGAFVLCSIGLLYTHYYAGLLLVALGAYHLLYTPRDARWRHVLLLIMLLPLTLLPWLPVIQQGYVDATAGRSDLYANALNPAALVRVSVVQFANGAPLLFIAAFIPLVLNIRTDSKRLWLLTLMLLALMSIATVVIGMVTEHRTRYLMSLWPLLALLLGHGLATLQQYQRWLAYGLTGAWLLTALGAALTPTLLADIDGPRHIQRYPPLREIVHTLQPHLSEHDLIVSFARTADIYTVYKINSIGAYYLGGLGVDYQFIGVDDWRAPTPAQQQVQLGQNLNNRLHVWLAYEPGLIEPAQLAAYRAIISADYVSCGPLTDSDALYIERYSQRQIGCLPLSMEDTPVAQFGGITLAALRLSSNADTVRVLAAWQLEASVPPDTYSVSFKIQDAAGNFIAQADYGLRGVGFGWQMATLPDMPGNTLTATVYNWRTGEIIPGTPTGSSTQSQILPLQVIPTNPGG